MLDRQLLRSAGAECLAVALFVFVCCGTAATNICCSDSAQLVAVSLAFGFTILVLAHMIGHISGGHINPAVTLGLAVTKRIDPVKAAVYVFAQVVGGILGALVLYGTLPKEHRGCLGSNTVGGGAILFGDSDTDFGVGQAMLLEVVTTAILVLTVFATVDPANSSTKTLGVFPIGMAVFICHLIAIPLTGCGINPARSLGPGLIAFGMIDDCEKVMDDHWVFWVGPFLGAILAALAYEHLIQEHALHTNLHGALHADVGSGEGPLKDRTDSANTDPSNWRNSDVVPAVSR